MNIILNESFFNYWFNFKLTKSNFIRVRYLLNPTEIHHLSSQFNIQRFSIQLYEIRLLILLCSVWFISLLFFDSCFSTERIFLNLIFYLWLYKNIQIDWIWMGCNKWCHTYLNSLENLNQFVDRFQKEFTVKSLLIPIHIKLL